MSKWAQILSENPLLHCSKKGFSCSLTVVFLGASLFCIHASAQTQSLIDWSSEGIEDRLVPGPEQVTYEKTDKGLAVRFEAGDAKFPGISIKPDGEVWNLSDFGHVTARVTNLGSRPLNIGMRIDNYANSKRNVWNTNRAKIAPGSTEDIKIVFGYDYGSKLAYELDSRKIVGVLFFSTKLHEAKSFVIEQITAAGSSGEKPPVLPEDRRFFPVNGFVLGGKAKFDVAEQVKGTKGCTFTEVTYRRRPMVRVDFPAQRKRDEISLHPPSGRWNFSQATEVRVTLKNVGNVPITPHVQVTSDGSRRTDVVTQRTPLLPGENCKIVIPFQPAKPWQGPAQKVQGVKSVGKPQSKGMRRTGTLFASDRADAVRITVDHKGEAALLIGTITAKATVADTPLWLGKRPPVKGDWTMTFQDEFDDDQIDRTKWNLSGPNHWGLSHLTHWSQDNVIAADGMATLRFEKKHGFHNDDPESGHQSDYTGGYLSTYDKWVQRYGYFESRMKLPTAPGLWPAFWTMPDRGRSLNRKWKRTSTSDGGMEFDIMEHLTRWGPYRYNIAMHWDGYGEEHKSTGSGTIYVQPDAEGFLTTGLLWTPGSAIFYCNGKETGRWESASIGSIPTYMMFTVPVGGWDNDRLDASKLPADYVIDYVRVWQRRDLATDTDGFLPPIAGAGE